MNKEQYYRQPILNKLAFTLFCMISFLGFINAQADDCLIRTAIEPDLLTSSYLPVLGNSTVNSNEFSIWVNPQNATAQDDLLSTNTLLPGQRSNPLLLQSFFADIPLGSTIHSVQIRITGASSDNSILQENKIQFLLGESPLGKNMADKSNIASPWKNDIHAWNYGHLYSDWDINWSYELLTDPELAIQLEIENTSDTDTLIASIDQLEILVNYTPLYELCSHDCVVFYNDDVLGATEYIWTVPEGVKFLNDNPAHSIVNLDFAEAEIGILDLELDIVVGLDTIKCNRSVLHPDCSEAFVGDYVWFDTNFDGIQDDSDFGIPDIGLKILNPYGEEIQSTTTDNEGKYQFSELEKGFYKIELQLEGFLPSPMNQTDADNDSDLLSNLSSRIFYVGGGDSIVNLDFGLFDESSLGGNIWTECDGDGIKTADEDYKEGVKIDLFQNGELLASTLTDDFGAYIFDQLQPGDYTVKLTDENPISIGNNTSNSLSSNLFNTDKIAEVSLGLAEDRDDINGALDPPTSMEIMVYFDENENQIMDLGENIFDGNSVRLFYNEELVEEAIVNAGHVQFMDLLDEPYTIQLEAEGDYSLESNDNYTTELIDNIVEVSDFVISCTSDNLFQFNFTQSIGIIGDYVWLDTNRDGIQNVMEQGASDVSVNLIDVNTAQIISSIDSDSQGKFEFIDFPSGEYLISFNFNQKYTATTPNLDDELGSKLMIVAENYIIGPFIYTEGQSIRNFDAGLVEKLGQISDQVWIDENRNNTYEENEKGLSKVTVELYNDDGEFVKNTTTNDKGEYSFFVESGSYYLAFSHDEYVEFVKYDTSIDSDVNSDVNPELGNRTEAFTISAGEIRTDLDAGYKPRTALVGDFVFLDLNEDGIQDVDEIGLSNFTIEAFDINGEVQAKTTTELGGFYQLEVEAGTYYLKFSKDGFDSASPNNLTDKDKNSDITNTFGENTTDLFTVEATEVRTDLDAGFFTVNTLIGDYIWQDNITNGVQDVDETGMASMQVNLVKIGEGVVETTFSGNGIDAPRGYYLFEIDQPGDYYLQFVLPDNSWSFTEPDILDEALDSDVSGDNGFGTTSTFFLEPGEDVTNKDAGVIGTSALIGDYVWKDDNNNGTQDVGEQGVNGMNIFLYDEFFNFIDVTISMYNTSTQQDGYYEFIDLDPGNYILVFDTEETFVSAYIGSDNAIDSDVTSEFTNGSTGIINIQQDQKSFHIDAGILAPNASLTGSIGDQVWEDVNQNGIYETDEPGIANVLIELLSETGSLIAEAESDENGMYSFDDIPVGDYKLYVELPDDYEFTIPNNSFDDDTDSDVQSSGETLIFSLGGGQLISNVDFGLIKLPGIISDGEIALNNLTDTNEEDSGFDNPIEGESMILDENPNEEAENIEQVEINHDFQVYPNPARFFTNLQYEIINATSVKIELISPQGSILQTIVYKEEVLEGKYTEYFGLENYQPGTYYIRMITDKQLYYKKFIVQ